MKILRTNRDLKEAINKIKNLGFVPTMGLIHNGLISLLKESKLYDYWKDDPEIKKLEKGEVK